MNPHGTTRHGYARNGKITPEWRAWAAIKTRCTNPRYRQWAYYGGRGIRICDSWKDSFEAFLRDVGPRPSNLHTVERIDNDGDYEPGNVRWATRLEQAANRRPRATDHLIEHNGKMLTVGEFSRAVGLNVNTVRARMFKGWPTERLADPLSRKGTN